jgi:hypothetical protein
MEAQGNAKNIWNHGLPDVQDITMEAQGPEVVDATPEQITSIL